MGLLQANKESLTMLKDVIAHFQQEEYTRQLPIISDSTIGQHIRHIIEFYECLINGVNKGVVCYDERERKLELEDNPDFALDTISRVLIQLEGIDLQITMDLKASFSSENGKDLEIYPSSVSRELAYCLEHTVHHLAIMKIAIREVFHHINLDENLGVAYSTIRYKKENVYSNVSA